MLEFMQSDDFIVSSALFHCQLPCLLIPDGLKTFHMEIQQESGCCLFYSHTRALLHFLGLNLTFQISFMLLSLKCKLQIYVYIQYKYDPSYPISS